MKKWKCSFFEEPQRNRFDDACKKGDLIEPKLGMSFTSEEEADNLYNRCAFAHGFSIRWYKTRNKNLRSSHCMLFKGRSQE